MSYFDKFTHGIVQSSLKVPMLSLESEKDLISREKQGDKKARDALVLAHLRMCVKSASYFSKRYHLSIIELFQTSVIALLTALDKFDPKRELRFSTCATHWIKASCLEYVLDNWSVVKFGTTTKRKTIFYKLLKTRPKYGQSRQELLQVIADSLNINVTEVREISNIIESAYRSLNTIVDDQEDGDSFQDFLIDPSALADTVLETKEVASLQKNFVNQALQKLDSRERMIIEERIMGESPKTLSELSSVFGISRERVRQIEVLALKKIKKNLVFEQVLQEIL